MPKVLHDQTKRKAADERRHEQFAAPRGVLAERLAKAMGGHDVRVHEESGVGLGTGQCTCGKKISKNKSTCRDCAVRSGLLEEAK